VASVRSVFQPNAAVPDRVLLTLTVGWIAFLILFWVLAPVPLLPRPLAVASALADQWRLGAAFEMARSLALSLQAIFFATVIGLGLSYLSTIPLFRAPVDWIGKLRFLSLTGVTLIFTLLTPNGHWLRVSVLAFAIVTFLVNDMMQVIDDIPPAKFDHARTLGMSQWQVLREVVIRGTLAEGFEAIRMNAAMAWMMLTMVEGLSRSGGGIGVLLLNLNRHMQLDALLGVQLMIFVVGIGQDRLIKLIKQLACPYTTRTR
jgi:NitT/TauT family transport system permease protein